MKLESAVHTFQLRSRLHKAFLTVLFAAITTIAVLAASQPVVHATGNEFRSLGGIGGTYAYVYNGWHGPNNSLDLHPSSGVWPASVYFDVIHYSGSDTPYVEVLNYASGTGCTGYTFRVWTFNWGTYQWVWLGDLSYVHIVKASVSAFYMSNSGYTIYYAGYTKNPEAPGCSWTGEHLHQQGTFTRNNSIYGGLTFNQGDDWNYWVHKITY